jgi:hypothetical protein
MRNMLQLLGGVAVAGAVAAGTTAFTASGLTTTAVPNIIGGGTKNVTVAGANLTAAEFTSVSGYPDRFSGIKVTLNGGTPGDLHNTNTIVRVAFNGTTSGATTTGTFFDCTTPGVANVWTCTIPTPASNYYTAVTSVDISVAPVLA